MDSLSGFTVFVRVAETRSIVGAARTLGVSASAVGKRVARLERSSACACSTAAPAASP